MRAIALDEYRARVWERKGVERVLQEAIEAALDVNAHLIAELGHTVPDDYFGGFTKLGDLGVLPAELAHALAPAAGLRNRLVHEYDAIDDAKVLAAVGNDARPLSALHSGDRDPSHHARRVSSSLDVRPHPA